MRRMRLAKVSALALQMLLFWPPMAGAQDTATEVGTDIGTLYRDEAAALYKAPAYSPYAGRDYPRRVLWGDTHLHTANSWMPQRSATRSAPSRPTVSRAARRWSPRSGQAARLSRPLDFLVVADHAEGLGSAGEIKKGNPNLMADPTLRRWHDMMAAGGDSAAQAAIEIIRSVGTGTTPQAMIEQAARALSVAELHQHRRALQRAWAVYRADRLRVDFEQQRQQPPSRGDLPRRQGEGGPDRAVLRVRQRGPGHAVEVPRCLYREDRRRRARYPAQRQPVQRAHVRAGRLRRPRPDPRLRGDASATRAGLRGDADQGRRRGASLPVAE